MMESEKLYGRKEIASYVGTLRRPASTWYVSAMIKAGLKVEHGNVTTREDVDRFFRENPKFSTTRYGRVENQTQSNTIKHMRR